MKNNKLIVLGSASPRRRELLKSAGIDFICRDHSYIEEDHPLKSPALYVKEMSFEKAKTVEADGLNDNILIFGVDTIVYHKNKILGKPSSDREALENIKSLSGKVHSVFTGVTIIDKSNNKVYSDYSETKVRFSNLDKDFIKYYIDKKKYEGFAGGYAIQDIFSLVVKEIKGSYTNVVGLPMEKVYELLNKTGFEIFR